MCIRDRGLPRVEEIFEARKPKGLAIITEFSGVANIKDTKMCIRDSCIRRQKLQLRYKDSAGSSIDQESLQPEIRFRRSEQEQSCYDHKSSGRRDRKIENAGPERCNSRSSYEHDRRNMPFYGCNRRGVS